MIKDYGIISEGGVTRIITTPDNKWLFVVTGKGEIKQISLESQEVAHDYVKIFDHSLWGLETTSDSKCLITSGKET